MAAPSLPKGITVSFSNTPQAKDDLFTAAQSGLTQDSLGVVLLDVMANDLGGNAKSLYALDDGMNSGGPTGDLLVQDAIGAVNFSAHGATIKITSDGKVSYDASTLDASFKDGIQPLTDGEFATDTFTYAIRLGNGALSWATAAVQIAGVNDAPAAANIAANANEDTGNPATLTASYTDADTHDTHTFTINNAAGTRGLVVDNGDGTFSYDPNGQFESLSQGDTATDTFTYTVIDSHGASSTKTATVTVHGENDPPTLQAAIPSGQTFDESTGLTLTATMAFADVDLLDTHAVTFTALTDGSIGTFTPTVSTDSTNRGDGSVSLSYRLTPAQFMAAGGHVPTQQDYRVTIDDHHGGTSSQIVSIPLGQILSGVGGDDGGGSNNHDPIIYVNLAAHDAAGGTVFDDFQHPNRQHVIGRLSFSDVEAGQSHSVNAVGNTAGPLGTLGTLFASIQRDTDGSLRVTGDPDGFLAASATDGVLKWDYQVNENRIQMLGQGQSHTDFFDLMLMDNNSGFATQKVAVLIQGANDIPVLQGDGDHSLFFGGAFSDLPNPLASVGLQQVSGFGFIDPDQNDQHTVSAHLNLAQSTVDVAASLTVQLTKDTHEFGPFDTNGELRWTYQLNGNTAAYLPGHAGEQRIQTWDVTIDDGHGGAVIPFVVTFNSAPVNQGPARSEASFTENASNPPPMSLHDNIAFTDVDPNDHHTVKVVEDPGLMNGAHAAGILHATLLPDTTNGTGGLVHFDYEVSEAAVQDLTAGQQKIDAFDVQIDDGHGGISHHLVKLTIFGSDF